MGIILENLTTRAGTFCLQNVNIEVKEGEHLVILGPTGSGKTLLLETIAGLKKALEGRIILNGTDITTLPPHKRKISYLPQDLALFPFMSVQDNILYPFKARGTLPPKGLVEKVVTLLKISYLMNRKDISSLSGGEKQKVAIARALLSEPALLLLDEPFSSLDAYIKRDLILELKSLSKKTAIPIIHVTHSPEEAFMLGEKMCILINGKVHQIGSKEEIYYHPKTVEVAQFLLNVNIFKGKVSKINEHEVVLTNGSLTLIAERRQEVKEGEKVFFGIRPEEVSIIRPDRPLGPQVRNNLFEGTIEEIHEKGASNILFVRTPYFEVEIDIPRCAFRDLTLTKGKRVKFSMKKRAVWYLKE